MRTHDGRKQVLLQRRRNTGFADGLWDFSFSGHAEHGESMTETAVREGKEELGLEIPRESLKFLAIVHKRERDNDITYINIYFTCEHFYGEPYIAEPFKCSQLAWFDIENLPVDLIDDRRKVFETVSGGGAYIEYGW